MWLEDDADTRINRERAKQAIKENPTIIATSCPFCITMFEDALKEQKDWENIRVMDVGEFYIEGIIDNKDSEDEKKNEEKGEWQMNNFNGFISEFEGLKPIIHDEVYVDVSARIIGNVVLDEGSSVWLWLFFVQTVLRFMLEDMQRSWILLLLNPLKGFQ